MGCVEGKGSLGSVNAFAHRHLYKSLHALRHTLKVTAGTEQEFS